MDMEIRDLIHDLISAGWSTGGIAAELRSRYGVQTAQPTIHRIKSGEAADPRWSTGWAVMRLHQAVFPHRWPGGGDVA